MLSVTARHRLWTRTRVILTALGGAYLGLLVVRSNLIAITAYAILCTGLVLLLSSYQGMLGRTSVSSSLRFGIAAALVGSSLVGVLYGLGELISIPATTAQEEWVASNKAGILLVAWCLPILLVVTPSTFRQYGSEHEHERAIELISVACVGLGATVVLIAIAMYALLPLVELTTAGRLSM